VANFEKHWQDPPRMLLLIQGCKRNDRESQRLLYQHFYAYAMSICLRYCNSKAEAQEVLNDGFMHVFLKISQYRDETSFQGWLRRIMVNAAIDHYRREKKHYFHEEMNTDYHSLPHSGSALDKMAHEELIAMIKTLSPAYRAVFNLYVIDGYTHKEISELLHIAEGTSKSNLLKAREVLRKMIENKSGKVYAKSVG
jgi:RNA polymerase sigma factor (sigma-70 family)